MRVNSSATKPGRDDIAEMLLKVALITMNQIKSLICFVALRVSRTLLLMFTFFIMLFVFKNK
jgi:hypothetical protein